MDRRAKVELFEEIRREYRNAVGSIRAIARKFGVHRRLVLQALKDALPPERKNPDRSCPKLGPVQSFIDEILEANRRAPGKQRHTAHRIYVRIDQELSHKVTESTVRRYVRERKRQMGLSSSGEIFIPLPPSSDSLRICSTARGIDSAEILRSWLFSDIRPPDVLAIASSSI
jgi:transposase-like protein